MSKEELIKYFDNLIGGFNTDNWGKGSEADYINQAYNYMCKIEQENQQLKEMFEDSKTFSKQFLYKHNKNLLEANEKLQQQRDKYREVFIELKTKILGLLIIIDEQDFLVSEEELEKLLQILDKVKEDKYKLPFDKEVQEGLESLNIRGTDDNGR